MARRWVLGALLFVGSAAGCESSDATLVVGVRTDLVAGIEFQEIRVEVNANGTTLSHRETVAPDADYISGTPFHEFGLEQGAVDVFAELLDASGNRVVSRRALVSLSGRYAITIVFTRDCVGVECSDAEATSCLQGNCVPAQCTPETPEACETSGCTDDEDCPESTTSCLRATCVEASCFLAPVAGACSAEQYCDAVEGCRDRPMIGVDGGPPPPDAAIDAGTDAAVDAPSDTGSAMDCESFELCGTVVSVGTAVGDLTAGNLRVTIDGSGLATFSAPLPSNVGVGDRVLYDSDFALIAGLVSADSAWLSRADGTTPAVATDTSVVIERAFEDIVQALWESRELISGRPFGDSTPLSLIDEDTNLHVAVYNDGPHTSTVQVQHYETDPDHYVHIFAPYRADHVGASQRHTGRPGTGAVIRPDIAAPEEFESIVTVQLPYVWIEGLELDGSDVVNASCLRGLHTFDTRGSMASSGLRFEGLLIHRVESSADLPGSCAFGFYNQAGAGLVFANNIIFRVTSVFSDSHGIYSDSMNHDGIYYNNTIHEVYSSSGANGIEAVDGLRIVLRNNFVGDITGLSSIAYPEGISAMRIAENNASSDDTASTVLNDSWGGSGNVGGRDDYGAYFTNAGGGDLHVVEATLTTMGLSAIPLQNDPDFPITEDIDLDPRPTTNPSIGADEP